MKHNKIFSSDVVHKGKTLDRVLDGGNNSNPSASCCLFNFDHTNPPIDVGESISDLLFNPAFDHEFPIQFVYSRFDTMYHNGLCDIIYPYNSETNEQKCESIFQFRHYRLDNIIRDISTFTIRANLTTTLYDNSYPDLCYKSYSVNNVNIDVDKKTVTYIDTIEAEGQTITYNAVFSFLVPYDTDSMGHYQYKSPKAIESINSGTQLKLYLDTIIDGQDYFLINIATQN